MIERHWSSFLFATKIASPRPYTARPETFDTTPALSEFGDPLYAVASNLTSKRRCDTAPGRRCSTLSCRPLMAIGCRNKYHTLPHPAREACCFGYFQTAVRDAAQRGANHCDTTTFRRALPTVGREPFNPGHAIRGSGGRRLKFIAPELIVQVPLCVPNLTSEVLIGTGFDSGF